MKARLAKVSLALLSTVFLLGCQEQGSDPVGPDGPQFNPPPHDHGGGGGGNNAAATLDLSGGMETPTALTVSVIQDSRKRLNVGNLDFMGDGIKMEFSPAGCELVLGNNKDALVGELTASVGTGSIQMQIDKTALPGTSDRHALLVQYDGDLGTTRIQLSRTHTSPPTVTDEGGGVFEFTGEVLVWALRGSGNQDDELLTCPAQAVQVTVNQ